jgi:hypothetical protein
MVEAAQHTATRHEFSLKPRHLTTYVDLPATRTAKRAASFLDSSSAIGSGREEWHGV